MENSIVNLQDHINETSVNSSTNSIISSTFWPQAQIGLNIRKVNNGFIVTYCSLEYVFSTVKEVTKFIEKELNQTNKK